MFVADGPCRYFRFLWIQLMGAIKPSLQFADRGLWLTKKGEGKEINGQCQEGSCYSDYVYVWLQ